MPSVHATAALPEHVPAPAAPATRGVEGPALVDARWLLRNADLVRVLDTRRSSEFEAGHIPGARSLPLGSVLSEDTSRPGIQRLALEMQRVLAERGIAPDDHVVLVDDADGSAALGAALCELAGMRRVGVVHGTGTSAWAGHGGTVEQLVAPLVPVAPGTWSDIAPRPRAIAAFEDVVDAVVDGTACVIDARSQLEHEGIVGAPCCHGRGAIPGSLHLEWTAFFDMAGDPRSADRVREIASHLGLDRDDRIIVSCHAGHRAAIATHVLRAAGFSDVRLSLGSWHEWSARGLGGDEEDLDA